MEIRNGKQYRTKAERLEIVRETLRPDTSVARVALEQGINANQIFQWRRQYREGRLGASEAVGALVPVSISASLGKAQRQSRPHSKATVAGTIEIEWGGAEVRIEGAADPDCIRAVLEGLRP